ncbi:MAG: hypothetical protein ABIE22_00340 [archaeon]
MITYNDIYEALRKERYSEQLQPIHKSFITDFSTYVGEKKNLANKEGDLFSDTIMKAKKQLENAISIFKELILRRKKKLLNLAFVAAETGISKRDFENMLPFEKKLFDDIMNSMGQAEKDVAGLLNDQKQTEIKNTLVIFKEDTDKFLGLGGENLGPFLKGDVANLPIDVAKILVGGKKADYLDAD